MDLKHLAASNPLVIFGIPECPWCQKAKRLLKPWHPLFIVVGSAERNQLQAMTGKTSVPQVYLKGKLLGGFDDTSRKIMSARTRKTLNSIRVHRNTRKVSARNLFWQSSV
jgi:glutaredoxin 3